MTTVHPMRPRINSVGAARLAADLERAIDAGLELGPRGPQIRGLGLSLGDLAGTLRAELGRLDALLAAEPTGVERSVLRQFGGLLIEIDRLVEHARTYPDVNTRDVPASGHVVP